MQNQPLPVIIPAGKIRYKAIYSQPTANPFRGRGPELISRTADVDANIPVEKVEAMARDMKGDLNFIRVEVVQ